MNYSKMYTELYEEYKNDPSSQILWNKIVRLSLPVIEKMLHSSKLYYCYREETKSDMILALYEAFLTYDDTKNANLYTWVFRLMSQAIWRKINKQTKAKLVTDVLNTDGDTVQIIEQFENYAKTMPVDPFEIDYSEKAYEILSTVIDDPLAFSILCKKRGLFGEEKQTNAYIIDNDIFDEKTIKYINNKINNKLSMLRKYITETKIDVEDFNIDKFNIWKKKINKKTYDERVSNSRNNVHSN